MLNLYLIAQAVIERPLLGCSSVADCFSISMSNHPKNLILTQLFDAHMVLFSQHALSIFFSAKWSPKIIWSFGDAFFGVIHQQLMCCSIHRRSNKDKVTIACLLVLALWSYHQQIWWTKTCSHQSRDSFGPSLGNVRPWTNDSSVLN